MLLRKAYRLGSTAALPIRREDGRHAADHLRRLRAARVRAAGSREAAERFAQSREGETQSGQVVGQIRPSQKMCIGVDFDPRSAPKSDPA
jgi:hypothetical protein